MKEKRIEKEVKVFEGFSGVGVTRLAIEDVSKELGINVSHVGHSEIEPCAVKAYRALHGNDAINYGDVTKIDWSKMDVDFLERMFHRRCQVGDDVRQAAAQGLSDQQRRPHHKGV